MPTKATNGPDRRALKILFDTHWTATGWRNEKTRSTSEEDFHYAKRAGIMFDAVQLSHDEIVDRAVSAVRDVDRRLVADVFVVSLLSRRLDLRSALGSFAVLHHLPRHKAPLERGYCPICGIYNCEKTESEDLNILNFERFKWGGVRHDQPLYASFDLEQFSKFPSTSPRREDVEQLKGIFDTIEASPSNTSSASLEKHLTNAFKSNKPERDQVIGILGLCGVLGTAAHPGYQRKFVPWSTRKMPARRFVDMAYPACWWTRSDGINRNAVGYWFGHLL